MADDRNNSDQPKSPLERYLAKQKAERAAEAVKETTASKPRAGLFAKAEQKAKEFADSKIKASQKAPEPPPNARAKPVYGKGERPTLAGIERPEPVQPPALSRWERVAESRLSEDELRAQEAGAPPTPPMAVVRETPRASAGGPRADGALADGALPGEPVYRVPVDEWRPITDAEPDGIPNAGFGIRLIASIVDAILLSVIIGILETPFAFGGFRSHSGFQLAVSLAGIYAYYGYFYSVRGASPGKLMLNLQVAKEDGVTRLTPLQAFLREAVGKTISSIPFLMGFVIVLIRVDHRALHDLLFETRVVRKRI